MRSKKGRVTWESLVTAVPGRLRLSSSRIAKRREAQSSHVETTENKTASALSPVPETHLAVTHKEDHGGVRRARERAKRRQLLTLRTIYLN